MMSYDERARDPFEGRGGASAPRASLREGPQEAAAAAVAAAAPAASRPSVRPVPSVPVVLYKKIAELPINRPTGAKY